MFDWAASGIATVAARHAVMKLLNISPTSEGAEEQCKLSASANLKEWPRISSSCRALTTPEVVAVFDSLG
jgi:hypothetical protein